jgi:hypothetical protein
MAAWSRNRLPVRGDLAGPGSFSIGQSGIDGPRRVRLRDRQCRTGTSGPGWLEGGASRNGSGCQLLGGGTPAPGVRGASICGYGPDGGTVPCHGGPTRRARLVPVRGRPARRDNGSTDETATVAGAYNAHMVYKPGRGLEPPAAPTSPSANQRPAGGGAARLTLALAGCQPPESFWVALPGAVRGRPTGRGRSRSPDVELRVGPWRPVPHQPQQGGGRDT